MTEQQQTLLLVAQASHNYVQAQRKTMAALKDATRKIRDAADALDKLNNALRATPPGTFAIMMIKAD